MERLSRREWAVDIAIAAVIAGVALAEIWVSMVIGLVITNLILKNWVARIRPYELIQGLECIVKKADDYSFPSGHTTAAFALAMSASLLVASPTVRLVFLILAFGVGFSRVYLAVHYPSDVLAGALIGTSFALIVHLFMPALSLIA